MDQPTKFKLGLWLATKRHLPFEWGKNDCNTLILEMHDFLYKTEYLKEIYAQYRNRSGAIRFAKRYTSAPEQLESIGYRRAIKAVTGDVLVQNQGLYYTGWIVFGDEAYSMSETEEGLTVVKINALSNYTIWRH